MIKIRDLSLKYMYADRISNIIINLFDMRESNGISPSKRNLKSVSILQHKVAQELSIPLMVVRIVWPSVKSIVFEDIRFIEEKKNNKKILWIRNN